MNKVLVFGCGYMLEMLHQRDIFKDFEIVAYCDNDSSKWGKEYLGKEIIPPCRIKELLFDEIIVTTKKYEEEIRLQLTNEYGISEDSIKCITTEMDKYDAELVYWKKQYNNEGKVFENSHYKRIMLSIAEEENDKFLENKVVADFGCGPRGSLYWIKTPCIKIGIDVLTDKYMKEFGSCLIKHDMVYVKCDEVYIPIGDETVDCLCMINSLDHVDNLEKMCEELVRILKCGGMLIGSFNLNEPCTYCEPQTLTYEKLEKVLLKYFHIKTKRIAYKGKTRTYENFEKGNLISEVSQNKEAIVWIKAIKK